VIGKAADVAFKTTGKVILQKDGALFLRIPTPRKKRSGSITRLYQRRKGHTNPRFRRKLKANQFTEALMAMETAGKQVDDEDLRD
jgi:DNA topoisomerase-3